MDWITDPTALLGFFTLVLLEIILGIDNLIFIAILADKLPPEQRDKARIIGLSLALIMRIALLAGISWLATLTTPWIKINEHSFSGRDLILIGGGVFLLLKATIELHERMEGHIHNIKNSNIYASFWNIIAQIVMLDAVFSIDSVVTAIGMANNISIMMAAVVISVLVMMISSKPLTSFVNAHPTVIMLCLGFLLMIGLSLIMEGFGFHIPKGYLYVAIGFSLTVEIFNLLARSNRKKILMDKRPAIEQLVETIPHLFNVKTELQNDDLSVTANANNEKIIFNKEEREIIKGVRNISECRVKEIMTPLSKIHAIDIIKDQETIRNDIFNSHFSKLVMMNKNLDNPLGFVQKKDIVNLLIEDKEILLDTLIRQPLKINENKTILNLLKNFKSVGMQIAFIFDKTNNFKGIVTLTDIMEFIADEIPEKFENK